MSSQLIPATKMLIRFLRYILITALSGDLLYLYYNGGWVEPIKWIEVSEVIILWALVFAGSVGLVYQVKREVERRAVES
ncbi:hypothetical protein ES703_71150 [subsurface metagenome]